MHTDSNHAGEEGLESPEEARASEGERRRGGHYAESAREKEVYEIAYADPRPHGPPDADAHAEEPGRKRIRSTASRLNATQPT